MAQLTREQWRGYTVLFDRFPLVSLFLLFVVAPLFRWLHGFFPDLWLGLASSLITLIIPVRLVIWVMRHGKSWMRMFRLVRVGVPANLLLSTSQLMDKWPVLARSVRWVDSDNASSGIASKIMAKIQGVSADRGPQILNVTEGLRGPVAVVATTVRTPASAIAAQSERIADIWGAPSVKVSRVDAGRVHIEALLRDPLAERGAFSISEFGSAHPGASPTDPIPLGYTETGSVANGSLHHTLIIGGTGSGKGSALWSLVWALAPARMSGLVKFVACDPKNSEFRGRERVFGRIHVTEEDIAEAVAAVRAEMDRRIQAATSRSFEPSADNPALVLLFDEFTSAPSTFEKKVWDKVQADLRSILSKGRSLGVFVVAAGQEATKERLALRDLFPVRIALRLANSTETDMVLGPGAAEAGASPHLVDVATPANGYRTAGIAYMLQEGQGFTSMRFPYASDDELDMLCGAMPE